MPKRKRPDEKPEDQFKRFLETAKKEQVDEDAAKNAFSTLVAGKKKAR